MRINDIDYGVHLERDNEKQCQNNIFNLAKRDLSK